ncbi:MAG: glycosyltransferase [Nanoarchaeota archaeon]
MKFLLICGASLDSGCWLKTQYLGKSLQKEGHIVEYIKPVHSKPFMFEYALSLCKYTFLSFFKRPDVVVGIKAYPNVTFPMFFQKFRGAYTVLDLDDLDYAYRDGLISLVSKAVQTPFPRFFDMVSYHNDNLRKHAIRDFKVKENRLYFLNQGVDFDVFNTDLAFDKAEIIKKYSLGGYKLIVYTAHLNVASDLDAILEAFSIVVKKRKNVKLIIVGGGQMLGDFKVIAKKLGITDQVVFTGYMDKTEVAKFIKLADICVVYYKARKANYFRTSMKIRENLAMGKRVVCNDVGDLYTFKSYTYQTGTSIPEFAEGIIDALASRSNNKNEQAIKFIQDKYSWEKIGRDFSFKLKELM